jgi:hypothetical protein
MSDTDLKALRERFDDYLGSKHSDDVHSDAGDVVETAWDFIQKEFEIAVPRVVYEDASTNVVRLQSKIKALPSREEILLLLSSMLWERGYDERTWPEDEALALKNVGPEQARYLMFLKASNAIGQRIDLSL